MAYLYNTFSERISEEANISILSGGQDDLVIFTALGHGSSPLINDDLSDTVISGSCTADELTNALGRSLEPDDSVIQSEMTSHYDIDFNDENLALVNCVIELMNDTQSDEEHTTNPIDLSSSVAVGHAQIPINCAHKIELVYQLEEYYRPRYKSDYFTHEGKTRKPRYVADRIGNHFITLQIPVGIQGAIRIDWLTIPTESGDQYSMPYRFQQSNDSLKESDCNPIIVNIEPKHTGRIKLYLVLIKSKQDELKFLQPLRPFHHSRDLPEVSDYSNSELMAPLNPKQLIKHYQLEKSQLAFTLCPLSSDAQTLIPDWNTTVYSTILTEVACENQKKRKVECPACKHLFEYSNSVDDNDFIEETTVSTVMPQQNIVGKTIQSTKKRKYP